MRIYIPHNNRIYAPLKKRRLRICVVRIIRIMRKVRMKTLAVMENMQIISWYNYKHGIRPRQQMCLVSEKEKYERDR